MSIELEDERLDMVQGIVESIDHMGLVGKQDDILHFLGLGMDFEDIASERTPRIGLGADDDMGLVDSHLDDLVVYRGIIEVSSEQEEDQHSADDIVVEDREHEYACDDRGES